MISPDNIQYLYNTISQMSENDSIKFSMGLVRDNVWTEEKLNIYEKELFKVADYYIKEGVHKKIILDFFSIASVDATYSSYSYCGAAKNMFGISPDGSIYPCTRFYTNKSPYIIGNLKDGFDINGRWYNFFKNYQTKNLIGCASCNTFNNYNCLGQCLAAMYETSGNPLLLIKPVCELLKITYRIAKQIDEALVDNEWHQYTISKERFNN